MIKKTETDLRVFEIEDNVDEVNAQLESGPDRFRFLRMDVIRGQSIQLIQLQVIEILAQIERQQSADQFVLLFIHRAAHRRQQASNIHVRNNPTEVGIQIPLDL